MSTKPGINMRLATIAHSQRATSQPPRRGANATSSPARISMMPTVYMMRCALRPSMSDTAGARYSCHGASTLKNLSAPAVSGITTNAQ